MPARGEVESDESLRIFDESWQPNHIPSSIGSFARYAQGIFFASQARKSTDSARLVFMFLLRVLCVGLGGVGENRHAMTDEEDCSCARDEREWCNDYFITASYSGSTQSHFQCDGSVRAGD